MPARRALQPRSRSAATTMAHDTLCCDCYRGQSDYTYSVTLWLSELSSMFSRRAVEVEGRKESRLQSLYYRTCTVLYTSQERTLWRIRDWERSRVTRTAKNITAERSVKSRVLGPCVSQLERLLCFKCFEKHGDSKSAKNNEISHHFSIRLTEHCIPAPPPTSAS